MLAFLRILLSFHFEIPHLSVKSATCEVYPYDTLTIASSNL